MIQKIAKYGWKKDQLDHRDRIVKLSVPATLPTSFSLQQFSPPIYDQEQCGSCTGNGVARIVDMERAIQGLPFITPSRLFIYYNERVIEGTVGQDAGAEVRDGIKVVAGWGTPAEIEWPYTINAQQVPELLYNKPWPKVYQHALKFKALTYSRVPQTAIGIKTVIASLGRPIVFGFSVFEAFESDQVAATGIVPMPGPNDTPIGGHCVCAIGYDDATEYFLCANSWNASWGQAGYFQMPYAYLLNPNLASDLWVIQSESPTV
jgi:C1A family cysteine protease